MWRVVKLGHPWASPWLSRVSILSHGHDGHDLDDFGGTSPNQIAARSPTFKSNNSWFFGNDF